MTAPEETTAPVVLRDVFPALVAVDGDPTYRSARVVVTRDRVYVYLTRTAPAVDAPYTSEGSQIPRYNAPRTHRMIVRLASGATLTVDRQRGCGCSSPLKAWRPWQPYRVAA